MSFRTVMSYTSSLMYKAITLDDLLFTREKSLRLICIDELVSFYFLEKCNGLRKRHNNVKLLS